MCEGVCCMCKEIVCILDACLSACVCVVSFKGLCTLGIGYF